MANRVRARDFMASMFALLLVIILAAFGAAMMGYSIPGLVLITNFFGFPVSSGG